MLTATFALALLLAPQDAPRPGSAVTIPDVSAHADVLEPVQAVFDAIRDHDAEAFARHIDPDARLTAVVQAPDGGTRSVSLRPEGFAAQLRPGGPAMEEIMVAPYVAVDGDVAVVWGRYIFRVDGRTIHCGVDHFDLVRRDGRWVIVNLTWNQRTTGCEDIEALIAHLTD